MDSPYTILYVSQASPTFQPTPGLDEIVAVSVPWNRGINVTGALIYSAGFFSQYLEGEQADVEQLLERIRSDSRHHSLVVANASVRDARLFPRWSLAYAGDAGFVNKELSRLFANAHKGCAMGAGPARLIGIMHDFIKMRARVSPAVH